MRGVWSGLKIFGQLTELAYLPQFRFDMGRLTSVKLGYIAQISYDFKSLKALKTIDIPAKGRIGDIQIQKASYDLEVLMPIRITCRDKWLEQR